MSVYVVAEREMPPRTFCQRLPAFRLPRARARSVHPSILPSEAGAVGGGELWKTGISSHGRNFLAFLPARFCAEYPDFALTDCGNPRPGVVLGDFLVSGGVPTATNRSLWTDFFCFLWESRGSVHRHLWTSGGACGLLGEFVRPVFYAYPQDSGGRVFLLQCPDSRSAGVAYGYAYRAFQHSFPQAVEKAGKSPQSFPHGVENRGCFRQWRCGDRGFPLASPATEPKRHWLSLPLGCPAGGVLSLSPADFAFSLIFCPHPPPPFPAGRGDSKFSYARGFAPCIPGLNPRGTYRTCQAGARSGALPLAGRGWVAFRHPLQPGWTRHWHHYRHQVILP